MKKVEFGKMLLCVGLSLLMVLSFAACKEQVDEQQDSTPPTETVTPTETPEPEPTPPIPYTDVPADAEYYDIVVWAYQNGIAPDGNTFEPDSVCTRAELIDFIWRAMGSPEPQTAENPISDISPDDWYFKPALWAYENGVTSNTTFNPSNPCTNAEVITILWRANGEPAAAVYNSPVSLANPSQYYTRAVAWAENGGMLAGIDTEFDPADPCSRADLMMYLYWAGEQWTYSEEDKTVQAEYEQIINDAQLYEVHGSGLVYADYVDVDGDGKVELLTVGFDGSNATAAIYANIDGHAGKACEEAFFTYGGDNFFACEVDDHMYLCQNVFSGDMGETYDYYRIENGAITFCEQASIFYRGETSENDTAILQKYTHIKDLFSISYTGVSVPDRGLLPDPSVVKEKIYAAVLNGDFSFFAGTYAHEYNYWTMTLDKDGIISVAGGTTKTPTSVTVSTDGVIHVEYLGIDGCEIYPVGVNGAYNGNLDKIRIHYWNMPQLDDMYYKVS